MPKKSSKKFKKDTLIKDVALTDFSPTYMYATEAVAHYYKELDLNGKTILTTSGSGDQFIDAYYWGAKYVLAFDLNLLSKHISELKVEMLKGLTRKQFLKFFGNLRGDATFDKKLFDKISKNLSKDARTFWLAAYDRFDGDGKKIGLSEDFFRNRNDKNYLQATKINGYLSSEKAYKKTQAIFKKKKIKLDFILGNVLDIQKNKKVLKKKYDQLNLSNIPPYILRFDTPEEVAINFEKYFDNWSKFMKKDGEIYYYYHTRDAPPGKIDPKKYSPPPFYSKGVLGWLLFGGKYSVRVIELKPWRFTSKEMDYVIVVKKI